MAKTTTTKEIVRGGVSLVGYGFDVAAFEALDGTVALAIAAAEILGLTADVSAVEELEFEISEYDGKPGRTEGDSTPRKANLTTSFTLKQVAAEILTDAYTTIVTTAMANLDFDKAERSLDPDDYTYQENVFFIGLRKDKKFFILVVDKAASESPLDLTFSDGEDVTHVVEFIANYDLATIRASLDRSLTAPYKLYIGKTV